MCASRWALSTGWCCAWASVRSFVSLSSAVNRLANGCGFSAGGAQSKSITGASPRDLSRASQRRIASSMASRRGTADFPPQRHCLAGLEVVAGHGDESVAGVVGADEVFGCRDLGSVGLLFDGGAVEEHVYAAVADVQGEVACVPTKGLPPVVIVDELAASADVRDGGHFATFDRWRDVAGGLGMDIHVGSSPDGYFSLVAR